MKNPTTKSSKKRGEQMATSPDRRRLIKIYKGGRTAVQPFQLKDFNLMIEICKNRMDKATSSVDEYMWHRNYILLIMGVNIGARIETLLNFMVRDVEGGYLTFTESKTGKTFKHELNRKVYQAIEEYIIKYSIGKNEFLLRGRKSKHKPITPQHSARIIKKLAKEIGVKYPVANHSMRKSWGRWEYDRSHDLVLVQGMYGHDDPIITLNYICMSQETVEKAKKASSYGV